VTAQITLGLALLAFFALFVLRERHHDAERRELIDRLTIPAAAEAAAFARALDMPTEQVGLDDPDDWREIDPSDDLAFIPDPAGAP